MEFGNVQYRATQEAAVKPSARMSRLGFAVIPLLAAGCATLATIRMTADEVVSTWVGHNVDELQSQWRIIWDSSKDSATGNKILIARFGENEHVVSNEYVEVQPVGNNQVIHNYVTEQQTVPKRDDCVVSFYWDPQSGMILRYTVLGDRCKEYVGSYGPAKAR